MPSRGDSDLQWAAANNGGIIEIAAVRLVHHIAQNSRFLAEPKDLLVQFRRICRAYDQENAFEIGRQKRGRGPINLARPGSPWTARRSFRRDHTNRGTAPNEALDFGLGNRPAADDKALASC